MSRLVFAVLLFLFPQSRVMCQEPPDSADLLGKAKEAQRDFERFHRRNLPTARGSWVGGCSEQVGPLCLRDTGVSIWDSPVEDSTVVAARDELLGTLTEIGDRIPGDKWVLSQRIRYLGNLGRWDEAGVLAEDCPVGSTWWCSALHGYVFHRSGQVLEAADLFQEALELMPPSEADRWRDPAIILDHTARDWISDPAGLTLKEAHDRFWTLADPLFLTPGNERLTEHFARWFGATLFGNSALTLGQGWGETREIILVRYGFIAGWERAPPDFHRSDEEELVIHWHPEGRHLLPTLEVLENPAGLPRNVWIPDEDHVQSSSAPILAPLVVPGTAQTAMFRREGDLLVVAAYGPPTDSLFLSRRNGGRQLVGQDQDGDDVPSSPTWEPDTRNESPETVAGLYLLPANTLWAPHSVMGSTTEGVLQLRAPVGRYLLSMELWNPGGRWGSRIRHGMIGERSPLDVPALSDLILLDPSHDLPDKLEEALPQMMITTELAAGTTAESVTESVNESMGVWPVRVGWEVYGLGRRREPLTFHLSLVREGRSFIKRALGRIGLFHQGPILTMSWTEGGAEVVGPFFRAIDLNMPPLEAGRYNLRLELDMPNRGKVVSNRMITVK